MKTNNPCTECRWSADHSNKCQCPTLPPLWGELINPTIANLQEVEQIAAICDRKSLQDHTAITIAAPMLAKSRHYCPQYSPKGINLCEGCANYVAPRAADDWEQCLAEPYISGTTQDPNGVIITCSKYISNHQTPKQ